MDPATHIMVEANPDDSYWEAYHRRGNPEGYWVGDFYAVSEMFDGNENAWDDLRRRERVAEAMYE